ncbi:hypothetical protein [Enterobacter hormaechei]|uniref:hypothetical protein n=1 Tax=Enterobacter hormaechei TaxID=158836 RepID=UPI000796FB9F|nr:hypothetical protein [Enterobacter hormaechei]DAL65920.1 MAG TPA_asm: hypothetical protein [Caudoviricetes sp.]SAF94482.1 Uncharacterised protein [Enterobacter hormaechei]VAC58909.1 Uncharacterised protein [Enterobacter hormaechei]VAC63421.1 Uncharacterised protein [Enterobacter hormaechei]VAG11632.1 Uncharacterised protein [Enterobacter hormaechei]
MESITKQLVNIGHGMSKEIAADEPAVAKLLVELSSALDVQYERGNALEAKCAALAAELNVVEAIHNDAVFITDDHYEQCPPEVQKIIRSLAVMQIPAYDAFLAEVRAQGVDSSIETLMIHLNHQYQPIASAIHFLKIHAAQLRQGADQ